ncbi:type IV toxin-antitoxin system AbiEi family antitoxin [Adlercreutzia sp. R21]|uniref:Type IV toxin-antitoxin system AbiEi family antitoxin n=1 Tax=Adlercreutzia wanghongyangiae TaxID=3111451 RepID=A0ABU6IFD4_9ACTN|nr:type IV toxin-antitoxin system AbiEi family antitoxin [Adlercreutzia sp. R21]MEC4175101.1 type IV toxin-antitoxin system AbiEi family antitoxin [Adlercreutzia sp. R7]MEC4184258.1 type IV toxin-antitoxin system AbiEi family antitoxin [Adlercreutzia sp. R21]
MLNEHDLILRAVERALPFGKLEQLEIHPQSGTPGRRWDASGRLTFGKNLPFDVCFETGSFQSMAALSQAVQQIRAFNAASGPTPLLVAPYLSPQKQQFLREENVCYLDAEGNAWVEAEGVFIDRCGSRQKETAPAVSQDPFSDKASLVIRLLFSGDTLGIRPISVALGEQGFALSPGYVSKVVASLGELHYATKTASGIRLVNRNLLLQDWSHAYQQKARRRQSRGWYLPEANPAQLARLVGRALEGNGALTDRSGASFVDPHASFDTVDILPSNRDAVSEILEKLGAMPVERGANVNVREAAYPLSSLYGVRSVDGVPVVSDLQLYLDLQCQPQRGEEAAEHLYERRIRPLLKEGDQL